MPRPARNRLSPWIESLILGYGSHAQVEEDGGGGSSSSRRLKAHVIGVGPMPQSQSQAQGSEGPTALLFLSDEVLQIPAMLTASAWERLQYQEERESLASLVNTTVYIQDYQLQFDMALEKTKCRFFLSVGELVTTAAGPVKENTPCCTTLPSVRQKICKTWRLLLDQETQDSQRSQSGFNLSDLLGEWQLDCLQTVLDDVRERLKAVSSRPLSPQPSTSSMTHPETLTATGWDVDRVRYKGEKSFSVPVKCLLIPEEDALQQQTPPLAGSRTPSGQTAASEDSKGDSSDVCNSPESAQLSVDDAEWRIGQPAVLEMACEAKENRPLPMEQNILHEDEMFIGIIQSDISPLTNPWDIFPPPGDTSSSSCAPSEATPTNSPHDHTVANSKPDQAAILTSTQVPVQSSKEPQQTSEQSILPPYQLRLPSTSQPASVGSLTSSSVKTPEPFTRLSNLSPATEKRHTDPVASNEVTQEKRKSGKAKRKSSVLTPEAGVDAEEEEAQDSRSPPSWLFDSPTDGGDKEDSGQHQGQTALRKTPTVHSDGKRFSYSYQVSGQNLQDFSQFKVAGSLLHWAVKYLVVPKQTDNPHDTSVTTNQTSSDRTEVTSN